MLDAQTTSDFLGEVLSALADKPGSVLNLADCKTWAYSDSNLIEMDAFEEAHGFGVAFQSLKLSMKSCVISCLTLSGIKFGDTGLISLANMKPKLLHLAELNVANVKCGSLGIASLLKSTMGWTSLTKLNISGNNRDSFASDDAKSALALALRESSLSSLQLVGFQHLSFVDFEKSEKMSFLALSCPENVSASIIHGLFVESQSLQSLILWGASPLKSVVDWENQSNPKLSAEWSSYGLSVCRLG
jgi:hypothetical protein